MKRQYPDRQMSLIYSHLIAALLIRITTAIEIDNGVVGTPTIQCGTDVISFWVKTRNAFRGKVYVKGEYGVPDCTHDFSTGSNVDPLPSTVNPGGSSSYGTSSPSPPSYSSTPSTYATTPYTSPRAEYCPPCPACNEDLSRLYGRQTTDPTLNTTPEMAHLSVKLGTCNIQRDRQLTPPGVRVSFTVVVSFHQNFVTKVDRAYQIQCAYMEADKVVTSEIDVSMPPTQELTQTASMPRCVYTIRRDTPDGPEIRFAKVGDTVYHRWECDSEMPDMFGILINNCYVDDGSGQRVQVLDERGCSIDRFVLPDLTYDTSKPLLAYVEAHVFKFADRAVLDFQCAISVCVNDDGGCRSVTPPSCQRRTRRAVVAEVVNRTLPTRLTGQIDENEWRLSAQRLTVIDLDDDIKSNELQAMEDRSFASSSDSIDTPNYSTFMHRVGQRVCLSVAGFGLLVSLCTFIFTMAAVIATTVYVLRRQQSTKSDYHR